MNNKKFPSVSLLFVLFVATHSAESQIKQAKVTGGEIKGSVSNGVSSFKGIPFAALPVGDLCWKAPQPVAAWTGVKDAKSFAPVCPEFSISGKVRTTCSKQLWLGGKGSPERLSTFE